MIENTFATAMYLLDNNSTVDHCQLNDIALHPGLGESNWGYFGIRATGSDMVFSNNRLEHIGYIGMVTEQNSLVEHNVVKHALAILNDGGGIAMDNADGMIVRENLVMDLDGEFESVAPEHTSFFSICHGIYFGNITIKNTLVEKNTVANCSSSGIHVDHTMVSTGNQVRDNVLFNNGVQLSISDYSNYNGPGAAPPYHVPAFNGQYTGNVMYCVRKDQLCMKQLHVYGANWVDYGTFDGNFYFNPYNERSILQVNHVTGEHHRPGHAPAHRQRQALQRAVVGQQPFGGSRASGTNDKAGSILNLHRWMSPRTIKETFVPLRDYRYPFLG